MIARATWGLAFLVVLSAVLSACSIRLHAGTSSTPREEDERRDSRRYRVNYRTHETTQKPPSDDDDKEKTTKFRTWKRDRVTARSDTPTKPTKPVKPGKSDELEPNNGNSNAASPTETAAGQPSNGQPANGASGATGTTGGAAGTSPTTPAAGEPVVLKPGSDTVDLEAEKERERLRRLSAQERIDELAKQKLEELKRKKAERKARMEKLADQAAEKNP